MKHLSTTRILIAVICWIILVGCGSAQATIEELRQERDALKAQLSEATAQNTVLNKENAGLIADLNGGRRADEWEEALRIKELSLNQREQELGPDLGISRL